MPCLPMPINPNRMAAITTLLDRHVRSAVPHLPHHYATIDIDGLARNILCDGGTEVGNKPGHLLIRGGTFHRYGIQDALPQLCTPEDIHAGGVDGTRTNGIDADPVRCQFLG